MKRLFLSLLAACCSSGLLASEKSYDLLLERYFSKDFSEIAAHANGFIDGVEHIALIVTAASPTYDGPVILLYRKMGNRAALVTKIDLQGDHVAGYDLSIKNNSLYLEHVVGHHGWHGSRYQFKQVENKFRMIGVESRSEALGCYAGDDSPKCDEYEAFSGTSYNLLTSTAICWRAAFSLRNERKLKKEASRKEYWQHPKEAAHHQMSFQPVKLPFLDSFNFFDVSLPNACYFDHKNKLRFERPSP